MRALLRCLTFCLVVFGSIQIAAAQAPRAEVRDEAQLFKPAIVARVNERLQEIRRTYHRDVLIETIKEIPKDELDLFRKNTPRNRAFAEWARKLAREHRVEGVYILIADAPRYKNVYVTTWPEDQSSILPPRFCEEIRRCFVNTQARNGPNTALWDTVALLEERLATNMPDEHAASLPISFFTLGLIIGGILLLWILAALLRMRLHSKQAPPEGQAAANQGDQHKHLPGMLGGMFGTVAGHWIYDQAFHEDQPETSPDKKEPLTQKGFPLELKQENGGQPHPDEKTSSIEQTDKVEQEKAEAAARRARENG